MFAIKDYKKSKTNVMLSKRKKKATIEREKKRCVFGYFRSKLKV